MVNKQFRGTGFHAEPKYLEHEVVKQSGVAITEFKKGKCFLCNQDCDKEGYVHLGCGNAYQDKKEENLKIWQSQQKGVKSV